MTNTITYDGVEYRKVKRKAEVGDLVLIEHSEELPEIIGRVGECIDLDLHGDSSFNIDISNSIYGNFAYVDANSDSFYVLEVAEPEQPVEASPSVIELLANLALRLTQVEDKIGTDVLKPTDDDETPTQSDSVDNVNSPQHYRHGRFETIELIEDITKKYDDGFVAYCVGNAVKYVDRAPFKHVSPSEDLRKAAWYLTRAADATTPPSS